MSEQLLAQLALLYELQMADSGIDQRRQAIASQVPKKIVAQFQRIADRLDGEALAPVIRDEEAGDFICGGCHMTVTQNTYVVLAGHSGDNLVTCPNCTRILYLED